MARVRRGIGVVAVALALSAGCSSARSGATARSPVPATDPAPPPAIEPTPFPFPSPSPSPTPTEFVPAAGAALPTAAADLAAALVRVSDALEASIARWQGDPSTAGGATPDDVVLQALYQQRIDRRLAQNAGLADDVIAALPKDLRSQVRDLVEAGTDLFSIVKPAGASSPPFRVVPPRNAALLLSWFQEGQRRFGVRWQLLAAVMGVESKFGRVVSPSYAGAQGPMQFIPSTWAAYGMGGNIHDAHDAILGAANYLHANGAPGNERRALFAYNHSDAYVDAVLRYARVLQRDPLAYFAYESWQVFVRTTHGDVRLTGPGT
jgi:membrane-bound lytic murein transglycosylase B